MNSPDWVEKAEGGSVDHGRMMAELARRQTSAQIEATLARGWNWDSSQCVLVSC
jgi:hypothetical protein